jgi:hypothetical protein
LEGEIGEIATNGGRVEPLSKDEIDHLCDRINRPAKERIPMHAWPTMWMSEDEVTQLNRAHMRALSRIDNFMRHACEISALLGQAPESIDFPYAVWMNNHVLLTHNRLAEPASMMSVEIRLDRAGGPDAATRKVAEYARNDGLACRVMNGNDEVPDFLGAAA